MNGITKYSAFLILISSVLMASSLNVWAKDKNSVKTDDSDTTVVVVTAHGPANDRVFNNGNLLTLTVTETANLRTIADQAGYDGESLANILFVVPADTTIVGKPGEKGIETGKWPTGVTLGLAVNGRICGGGGKGGDAWGQSGERGGDAIYVQAPILIVVAEKGAVESGGGGGGGARASGGGAGGGGGGFPNGGFGMGVGGGNNGREGNRSGGGRGGNNIQMFKGETSIPPFDRGMTGIFGSNIIPGGNGGDAGMDGDSISDGGGGGTAGYAVRANGTPVQFIIAGRVRGQVG
jgi:hypothetical protein